MRVVTEVRAGLFSLLLLQLVTAFAAIGLLARMSPAVDQILRENVYSMEAADDMLVVLVQQGDPARFDAALQRAVSNVTEPEESALLDVIAARYRDALAGDPEAAATVARELGRLTEVNRASMDRADARARALGWAGAWSMVFLGALSFGVALVVVDRQQRRLVAPIVEIHGTLAQALTGDPLRRCLRIDGPEELQVVADGLNRLLDQRIAAPDEREPGPPLAAYRELLHLAVDAIPGGAVAGAASGQVLSFHRGPGDLSPREVAEAIRQDRVPEPWVLRRTPGGAWLALRDGR